MPAILFFLNFFFQAPSDAESSFRELGDLGNLLLGGFVLAVAIAIAFTFVRLRLRDKKPAPARFISISTLEKKE